jgi:electron transfer flavoprotein alpha subunit
MPGNVLFFGEQRGGTLRNVSREAAAVGRELADRLGVDLEGVIVGGGGLEGPARELAGHGADRVHCYEGSHLENYSGSGYAACLEASIREHGPAIVLVGGSAMGKDLAPRVAGRLGVGLASDCTGVDLEGDSVIATRPVYAGKAYVRVRVKGSPAMVTLRPKAFPVPDEPAAREGEIVRAELPVAEGDLKDRVVEIGSESGGKVDLTEADIIVSGGRGLKSAENFHLIEELAEALGGVVGASRAVVDAGWRSHNDQVGQTGKVVNPTLYIACGISGAIQHLAGMRSSRTIVAINKDPEAPIFKVADYGIVGDLFEVLPRLTEEVRKIRE